MFLSRAVRSVHGLDKNQQLNRWTVDRPGGGGSVTKSPSMKTGLQVGPSVVFTPQPIRILTQYLCSGLWSRMNSLSELGQLEWIVPAPVRAPCHILMFCHVPSLSDETHWGLWCLADALHVLSWVKVNTLFQTGHQLRSPGSKLRG